MVRLSVLAFLFISIAMKVQAQSDSVATKPKQEYQIFLKQPAKEIKFLWYNKNMVPIQGRLSEDRKAIIMKDYERGSSIHVKVIYEDGTVDEFNRTPCYIDPVIT